MSFLNSNNSEFLSARITKKGRMAIARGNFNIEYFQVGDSEFDYTPPFSAFTGLNPAPHQMVLSPFDIESGVKYPYKLDTTDTSTTYGNPIENAATVTIRNIMGPAGFISNFIEYDDVNCTGTTIACATERVNLSLINGSNYVVLGTGCTFENCEFVTISFNTYGGLDPQNPVVTGNSGSLIYKITGITLNTTGTTLFFDRDTPNFSGLTGYAQITCNKCRNEYDVNTEISPVCIPNPIDTMQQLDPWTLNVVWGDKPIGSDENGFDENLTGYTSNVFVSTKELLGYTTSSGQTFTDFTGGTITGTSYFNSFGEEITVSSEEQRCIAIIHYSELGDIINDPERFFKYDDYISNCTNTGTTGNCASIIDDINGVPISDTEYFEVFLPFIYYHRNTGTTYGATFRMDDTDYYMKSSINPHHELLFRYLIDEQGYRVGKVFVTNKIIVFDDQELVAILDYKSNRRYTLPAPKVSIVPSDTTPNDSLLSGTTGQTIWVTYMFGYTGDTELNGLPCNYYNSTNLSGNLTACAFNVCSQVTMKISGDTIPNMYNVFSGATHGFIANKFYILAQETLVGELPTPNSWRIMDYTTEAGGNGSLLINPTGVTNVTYVITKTKYDNGTLFDLENYLSLNSQPQWQISGTGTTSNYIPNEPSSDPQFGDQQPFPGSIRLIRASDIEQMNFLINLPSSQFTTTQNPTYINGVDKRITEIALLDSNKEVLVISKTPTPVKRVGTQVFSVRLDF
jgi:hypothetical protein